MIKLCDDERRTLWARVVRDLTTKDDGKKFENRERGKTSNTFDGTRHVMQGEEVDGVRG